MLSRSILYLLLSRWILEPPIPRIAILGFLDGSVVKNPHDNPEWVSSLGQEDILEKGMQPTPVFLPGKAHGQRSLAGYSPRGHKESDRAE